MLPSGDHTTGKLPFLAYSLANSGYLVIRFTCKSTKLPTRASVTRQIFQYAFGVGAKYPDVRGIFLAGHSMGCRVSCEVANELVRGDPQPSLPTLKGLLLFSYPLHPPGKKTDLRDKLLCDLSEDLPPVLFISGTKDTFCDEKIMASVRKRMKAASLLVKVAGGNHSLRIGSRQDLNALWDTKLSELIVKWMDKLVNSDADAEKGLQRTAVVEIVKRNEKNFDFSFEYVDI